ncbi:hypothetical protein LJ707_11315 [Mucilaginibacter sp. UR6-1]|uniref:S41 family peptidase n=1 Tax=Mucilaginibacter sp. UR6-1 TaxID=1435643 RepID=UPI001E59314D|nr:S41 family peptidase [Mucilaginibacter sp. UR6-1]MCC8409522.1 hypothetical protein [Mucilaginibacter sp. UR6-1]
MKILFTILIGLLPITLVAQDCDCGLNFDYTVKHVKSDYAGFNDKVKNNNRKEFELFTKSLRKRAAGLNNTDSCFVILRTWTNYFKDNHLRVQLDWQYRKKHPEEAKKLAGRFAKPVVKADNNDKPGSKTNISKPDSNTLLIRLPSFVWDEKKNIDSVIQAYSKQLKEIPNWIIDLRGNDGGTDYAFSAVLPYLYTNPIQIKPDEYRSSKGNIEVLEENLKDDDLSKEAKSLINNLIGLMKANPDGFVNPSGKENFEIKLDTVHKYPSKVAVLIDRNTASSAESFLIIAKQSKKVKVYGENSAGTLDYANTQYFDIPCKDLNLVIPISRSKRLPEHPIDNIGILPDVKLDPNTPDKINTIKVLMRKQ